MEFVFSELESLRFNKKIFRCSAEKIDVKLLQREILSNCADITFLRIPSAADELQKLDTLGIPYGQMDTLVYYKADLDKHNPSDLKNSDITFEVIKDTEDDAAEVARLVKKIFVNYTNHYYSNRYLSKTDITAGYVEWVLNYNNKNNGKISWFLKKGNRNIGFSTCSYDPSMGSCEGVLYGIDPEFSGGGLYGDMIRFTQRYFKDQGLSKMKVSTQVQNFAVQKVWAREGFSMVESYSTVHVNSLLNHSEIEEQTFEFNVTEDQISQYGKVSGDLNPIHFNDEAAKKLGFDGRIAHGLIMNSILSKFYGTSVPGNGTLFLGYKYKFYRPIYPDRNYVVKISFPFVADDFFLSVARVYDADKKLCLLAYSDLMNRRPLK